MLGKLTLFVDQIFADNCQSCVLGVGLIENGFLYQNGTVNIESNQFQQVEGVFLNGCNTLFPNNEEYLNFCASGVETFLPAIIKGVINDYPPKKICEIFGVCEKP